MKSAGAGPLYDCPSIGQRPEKEKIRWVHALKLAMKVWISDVALPWAIVVLNSPLWVGALLLKFEAPLPCGADTVSQLQIWPATGFERQKSLTKITNCRSG
uniref:Uncharacterized protein n=2 Tax=Oryza sativa subsp. japonica TaxID=39947 RepID=Q2R9R3_ORYSJ|nr:hypothetical protein LOC_Os11g07860 [Oryza sativa Japonica Group]ABA91790.1 hypothetical protein LOC_Os11g07860 [Oryza sativa Japonica Group]